MSAPKQIQTAVELNHATEPGKAAKRRKRPATSVAAYGEPMVWLTGGALACCIVMIVGLLLIIIYNGLATFWPKPVALIKTVEHELVLGEVTRYGKSMLTPAKAAMYTEDPLKSIALVELRIGEQYVQQRLVRVGNNEISGNRFQWVDDIALDNKQYDVYDLSQLIARLKSASADLLNQQQVLTQDHGTASLAEALKKQYTVTALIGNKSLPTLLDLGGNDRLFTIHRVPKSVSEYAQPWPAAIGKPIVRVVVRHPETEGGIDHPQWAMLVERRDNGVFNGYPKALVETYNLDQMIEKLTAQPKAVQEQVRIVLQGVEKPLSMTEAIGRTERYVGVIASNAALKCMLPEPSNAEQCRTLVGYTSDLGDIQPMSLADAIAKAQPIIGLVNCWQGEADSWQQFQARHAAAMGRHDEFEYAKEYELGPLRREGINVLYQYRSVLDQNYYQKHKWDKTAEQEPNQDWMDAFDTLMKLELEIEYAKREIQRQQQAKPVDQRQLASTQARLGSLEQQYTQVKPQSTQLLQVIESTEGKPPAPVIEARRQMLRQTRDVAYRTWLKTRQINKISAENEHCWWILATASGQGARLTDDQIVQLALLEDGQGNIVKNSLEVQPDDAPPFKYKRMHLDQVMRAYPANQLTFFDKLSVYVGRWMEFLTTKPRNANMEGGVFPAIFGTVVMTMLMVIVVVPFGVMAALYLREYAKAGPVISAIRIAINNLAGVPSIVYGVFGLGFFCYMIGGWIDKGPEEIAWTMSQGLWWTLVVVGLLCGLFAAWLGIVALRKDKKSTNRLLPYLGYISAGLWVIAAVLLIWMLFVTPYFDGLYRSHGNNPVFGAGGLLWASLTLALLTLPVVIVATEEALSAVPNSMREGSYACGASKWQTLRRIVLPRAMPGIMTGMILAMARGAGEVAPLMLVGAVKYVPHLPFEWPWADPIMGMDRKFMHLGFHIFDVGFQSPDSEAAKPMVFTTTLLLIGIIAILNIAAILIRAKLRKKFAGSQF